MPVPTSKSSSSVGGTATGFEQTEGPGIDSRVPLPFSMSITAPDSTPGETGTANITLRMFFTAVWGTWMGPANYEEGA